ncbi:MAG: RNA polymerase sigma factor [Clostridia bacterium]|nr:RNA polymerase sigma factor [Clostridia bacterium]
MEDKRIIELFWQRQERAIAAAKEKYGAYCTVIACNILGSYEDIEECLSDTWLRAWESIPPQRPDNLRAFLARITRNLAFSQWRQRNAEKRGGGELPLILDELSEVVSGHTDVEKTVEQKELAAAIEGFLDTLPERTRRIFVCRYWYADPVREIARVHGMKENAVSMQLSRTREKLRNYLTERGFEI